jgi:hypothetical protein
MKSLVDSGLPLPDPAPATGCISNPNDRNDAGRQLLQFFLNDGVIRGISPDGEVFDHEISSDLSKKFLADLKLIKIKGCQKGREQK